MAAGGQQQAAASGPGRPAHKRGMEAQEGRGYPQDTAVSPTKRQRPEAQAHTTNEAVRAAPPAASPAPSSSLSASQQQQQQQQLYSRHFNYVKAPLVPPGFFRQSQKRGASTAEEDSSSKRNRVTTQGGGNSSTQRGGGSSTDPAPEAWLTAEGLERDWGAAAAEAADAWRPRKPLSERSGGDGNGRALVVSLVLSQPSEDEELRQDYGGAAAAMSVLDPMEVDEAAEMMRGLSASDSASDLEAPQSDSAAAGPRRRPGGMHGSAAAAAAAGAAGGVGGGPSTPSRPDGGSSGGWEARGGGFLRREWVRVALREAGRA